jgi:hypothetical protein
MQAKNESVFKSHCNNKQRKKDHGFIHDLSSKPSIEAINLCNYFTASLSALPGLNAGTLLAPISISSPV